MKKAGGNISGKYKEDKDQNELTMFYNAKIANIIQLTPYFLKQLQNPLFR